MVLHFRYRLVMRTLQRAFRLLERGTNAMRILPAMMAGLLILTGPAASLHAWSWDDDESIGKDELETQLLGYRKRVESGIPLSERIVLLDRLIKLYGIHGRDAKALELERAQVIADEQAVANVSAASREKSQSLFQQAFEQIKNGHFREAQRLLVEAEHLNPQDKIISDLRAKTDQVAAILAEAPLDPTVGDLVKRGVLQYVQNEPSKALNFLVYAQQKDDTNPDLPALVELAKRSVPESSEILDTRLNLIDQKLQRALEKIYSGEYLVAAKECQEVLDLEPDNALALTRLGSVYYAMGQVKQARSYWKQAQTLDPKNNVLKSFMDQTATEADRAPAQALTYKVEKGDTLQTIAEKVYKNKSAWRRIYEANRAYMKNPYQLSAGQVLVLPPGGVSAP